MHYSGEPYDEGQALPPLSFTGPVLYGDRSADALASWSRQVAKHLEQGCRSPIDGCCGSGGCRLRFDSCTSLDNPHTHLQLIPRPLVCAGRRCRATNLRASTRPTLYFPLTLAGEAAPRHPYGSHTPPDSHPAAFVPSVSLPEHFPSVDTQPPRALDSALRLTPAQPLCVCVCMC